MNGLHLILGGSRSGKSCRAEVLASKSDLPVVYIATYSTSVVDLEMRGRIERHRERRPSGWKTIEDRFDLSELIVENADSLLLLDCLTLWLSYRQMRAKDAEILRQLEEALQLATKLQRPMIIVSNELGSGLVPESAEARQFRDLAGMANQLVARHASMVELVVAGLPLVLKGAA